MAVANAQCGHSPWVAVQSARREQTRPAPALQPGAHGRRLELRVELSDDLVQRDQRPRREKVEQLVRQTAADIEQRKPVLEALARGGRVGPEREGDVVVVYGHDPRLGAARL